MKKEPNKFETKENDSRLLRALVRLPFVSFLLHQSYNPTRCHVQNHKSVYHVSEQVFTICLVYTAPRGPQRDSAFNNFPSKSISAIRLPNSRPIFFRTRDGP
jgi:hypothetical protein